MRKLFGSIVLLTVLWLVMLVGSSLLYVSSNDNHQYIPNEASAVIIFHGDELLRHTVEDVILKTHDNDLIRVILDAIQEPRDGKEFINTGIEYNSDLIYYSIKLGGKDYNGLLVNLVDENMFIENTPKLFSNIIVLSEEGVGLVLQEASSEEGTDLVALKLAGDQLFKKYAEEYHHEETNDNTLIANVSINNVERNSDTKLDLDILIEEQDISFQGTAAWDANKFQHWAYRGLSQSGLHISSSLVPEELEDTLKGLLSNNLPDIISFSMNYVGTDMVETPIFRLVPNIDLLVEFGSPYVLDSVIQRAIKSKDITNLTAKTFKYGGKLFYYEQIDPLTIYLGRRQHGKLIKIPSGDLLFANGDLASLTKVEGEGIMRKFLELLSIYNAGKEFVTNTKNFSFSIRQTDEGKATVNGAINFREGKRPTNEIIRLLLKGDLI